MFLVDEMPALFKQAFFILYGQMLLYMVHLTQLPYTTNYIGGLYYGRAGKKKQVNWIFDNGIMKVDMVNSVKADVESRFQFKLVIYKDADTHIENANQGLKSKEARAAARRPKR